MQSSRVNIIFSVLLTAILIAVSLFYPAEKIISPTTESNKPAPEIFAEILFVGDMMFDRGIRYYANLNGGNDFVFEKIHSELLSHDLVLGNLEGPITDNPSVSAGTAPGSASNYLFTFDPSWAKTLYSNNIKIVSLGNNHILNFGRGGLASTKNYLDKAGVSYFGSPDYPKIVSTEIKGVKITFINYNQFMDLAPEINKKSTLEEIEKAKEFSDIIIVFCHWGAEYAGPDQEMQNLAHSFIDQGADLVLGSHSHVTGPVEEYKNKRIYYSLGNFIFDQYFSEETKTGLGVAIKINSKAKKISFEEKQFYMQANGQTILVEKNGLK